MALIPDIVLTILSAFLMAYPSHRPTSWFHPVFALVSSIFLFSIYLQVCWLNIIVAYSDERQRGSWMSLVWFEVVLQAFLTLMWLAMMVYSCVAVHRWRKTKKMGRGVGDVEQELGERSKS